MCIPAFYLPWNLCVQKNHFLKNYQIYIYLYTQVWNTSAVPYLSRFIKKQTIFAIDTIFQRISHIVHSSYVLSNTFFAN